MIKESLIDEWDYGYPAVEILRVSRGGPDHGWFEKRAAILTEERSNLRPVKGHTPLYMIPMGAAEFFGMNRNADLWPAGAGPKRIYRPAPGNVKTASISAGLLERSPTFETHAKIFKNHDNRDPSKASGFIHSASFNPGMGRVEAIAYVKNASWDQELARIESGKNTPISMSASVPHDWCSWCGNKAKEKNEYCSHLRMYKTAVLEDGHQVGAWNERPTFVDLSSVHLNADRIGYGLAKLATGEEGGQEKQASLISTVDVTNRLKLLEKLANIEKEISEGAGNSELMSMARGIDPRVTKKIPGATITIIRSYGPPKAFGELSRRKILLPPEEFFRLASGDSFGSISPMMPEIESLLPRIFRMLKGTGDVISMTDGGSSSAPDMSRLSEKVRELEPSFSMKPKAVKSRVVISCSKFTRPPKPKKKEDREEKENGQEKEAAFRSPAGRLAAEYGKYVLASLPARASDRQLTLAALSNAVRR